METTETLDEEQLIEVCDACLTAACWYGEFMCQKAEHAGTILKTVAELRKLNAEHERYWSDAKLEEIYGCIPDRKTDKIYLRWPYFKRMWRKK